MSASEALLLVTSRAVLGARNAVTSLLVEAHGWTRRDAREVRNGEQVAGLADGTFGGRGAALAVRRTREALALVLEGPGRARAYAVEVVQEVPVRAGEAMVFGWTHARVAGAVTVATGGSIAVRVGRALAGASAQVERAFFGTAQALIWMGTGARETGAVAGSFLALSRFLVRYGVGWTRGDATAIRSQEELGVALGAHAPKIALGAPFRRARLALLRVRVEVLPFAARLRTAAILRDDALCACGAVVVAITRVAVVRARLARVGRLVFEKAPGALAHAQLGLLVAVLDSLALQVVSRLAGGARDVVDAFRAVRGAGDAAAAVLVVAVASGTAVIVPVRHALSSLKYVADVASSALGRLLPAALGAGLVTHAARECPSVQEVAGRAAHCARPVDYHVLTRAGRTLPGSGAVAVEARRVTRLAGSVRRLESRLRTRRRTASL